MSCNNNLTLENAEKNSPRPRVLVVGVNAFSQTANSGKTLTAIFKNYRPNEIGQLFFYANEKPDWSFCRNYFRMTFFDILKSLRPGKKGCGTVLVENNNSGAPSTTISNSKAKSIGSSIIKFFKKHGLISEFLMNTVVRLNRWQSTQLDEWIRNFDADIIFLHADSCRVSHHICRWISKKYNIRVCIFCTDDYVLTVPSNNFLVRYMFGVRKRFFRQTVELADGCFAIGEMMAEEYSRFFGKKFIPLMNCVNLTPPVESLPNESNLTIAFMGGLHLNRDKSIIAFGALIDELNKELENPIRVNIYTAQQIEEAVKEKLNCNCLNFMGALTAQEVESTMGKMDFLLHVESEDPLNRKLTRLSVSTKIPEYLMASRCIIAVGPHEVASIQLLQKYDLALVLTDLDTTEVKISKLKNVLNNLSEKHRLEQNGRKFAEAHFNGTAVRKEFEAVLQNVAANRDYNRREQR